MRKRLTFCFVTAFCLGLAASSLAQRAGVTPRTGTAVVDTNIVAKNLTRLTRDIEALKAEGDTAAASLKKEAERGNEMTEKARRLPPDSPDRKQLEAQLVKMKADFELRGKRLNDQMGERRLRIVYGVSRELNEEMARFAQANGVQLVLRKDTPPAEFNDPQSIMQEIQKLVVYDRDSDATMAMVEAMNRRAGNTATKAPPAANGVKR